MVSGCSMGRLLNPGDGGPPMVRREVIPLVLVAGMMGWRSRVLLMVCSFFSRLASVTARWLSGGSWFPL